jgi:hypothetical protein
MKQRRKRRNQRGARQKTEGTLRAARLTHAELHRAYALLFDNITASFLRQVSADFTA